MSLSDRRAVLLGLGASAFVLTGCLRPMLAADGPASGLLGRIAFPDVEDRFDYFLDQSLAARLGRTSSPAYRLEISTKVTERGLAIAQDNSVTRITLIVDAGWTLRRMADNAAVIADDLRLQSGYSATSSLFATRQTKRDVERRLARDLGERIARVLLARADEATG
ncbi:MAG: hypothetical protein AAF439_01195 [Pseudomonadota bacterium]